MLRAQLLRPMLIVSPAIVEFGTVHINHRKQRILTVSNPTDVDAEWQVKRRDSFVLYAKGI